MSGSNVVIFANGEKINEDLVKNYLPRGAVIVSADGGGNICAELGIEPDYLIGDFDSISPLNRERFVNTQIIPAPDQNHTDMQKALEFVLELNPQRIIIFGAYGLRKDHAVGNLLIFHDYAEKIPLEIIDNYGRMTFLGAGSHKLTGLKDKTVSLISFYPVKGLTERNFKYNLENVNLSRSFLGVSNVAKADLCEVEFSEGMLIFYEVF